MTDDEQALVRNEAAWEQAEARMVDWFCDLNTKHPGDVEALSKHLAARGQKAGPRAMSNQTIMMLANFGLRVLIIKGWRKELDTKGEDK